MNMGAVFLAIEREAESHRGFGSVASERDADKLEAQVRFYKYGRDGTFPPEWADFKRQVERESDPDWAELQRLKKKFGE